jgi:hypothetical protein
MTEVKGKLRFGGSDLGARGAFLFFFTGKKNQKPRDEKNSLLHYDYRLAFWYAVSPVTISLIPLSDFMAVKRPSCLLGQFFVT